MKQLMNISRSAGFLLLFAFTSVIAFAQEKKIDVDIDTNANDNNWWTKPWVWIGGAVFILLLVALLRRKSD